MTGIQLPKHINIFTIAGIFPILSVFSCWAIYYSMKQNTPGLIRTISETMNPFPENRIFPVTMNIECVFLVIVYWLRNSITESAAKDRKLKTWSIRSRLFLMKLCVPFSVIGLSVLSCVTLKDNKSIHLGGAALFFYVNVLYFFLCDLTGKEVGFKVGFFSKLVSFLCPLFLVLYQVIIGFFGKPRFWRSIGALCQYAMCMMIFVKIFMFQFDLPKVRISNIPQEKNKK